jgi:hypothetical protein
LPHPFGDAFDFGPLLGRLVFAVGNGELAEKFGFLRWAQLRGELFKECVVHG